MSQDLDAGFSEELNNMMQQSIEQETSVGGLLDLEALASRMKDEVKVLEDYKSKLINNKSAIMQAISLVNKRVKAISSAIAVLTSEEKADTAEVLAADLKKTRTSK